MYIMLLKIESPSNNNEYMYTLNIPIYIFISFQVSTNTMLYFSAKLVQLTLIT